MPVYMDHPDMKGGVETEKYEKQIELLHFRWGVNRNLHVAGKNYKESGSELQANELTFQKPVDASLGNLYYDVLGLIQERKDATITFLSLGTLEPLVQYKLKKVKVTSYGTSYTPADAKGGVVESVSLTFSELFADFKIGGKTMKFNYDMENMKEL